jgi:asparagine synthase (glutamine-hydrolysing)
MTLIAGLYSRRPDVPVDRASRDVRCCIVHADIGAFGVRALHRDAQEGGSITAMTGEAFFAPIAGEKRRDRADDVRRLHEAAARGDWDVLRTSRGVFSVAHYDPRAATLTLITDKLSVRPLYIYISDEHVIFASALRILEQLPMVRRVMDLRGVTETTSFGFSLGVRTPYANITRLRAGERMTISAAGVQASQYWRWDEIPSSGAPFEDLARRAFEAFDEAVQLRRGGDGTALAFLSGGLDSRAIVVALHEQGVRLHTFNFARPGTLDQRFGRLFATTIGTQHEEVPMGNENPRWAMLMARAWQESPHRAESGVEHPAIAWSGDGGSVGIGHVYISRSMAAALGAGEEERAIDIYLSDQRISVLQRLLTPAAIASLGGSLHQGIREELADIRCSDRIRAFHIFLMLNDQRRHLSGHFEEIDLHRTEYQLPFFDADVLSIVMSVPGSQCVGHEFYMKWFSHFPAVARSTPWQTYPGHVPCPLPVTEEGIYQWDETYRYNVERTRKRDRLRRTTQLLSAQDFPAALLRKPFLRLATWVYRTGLRDYGYVLDTAGSYHRYWHESGGRHQPTLNRG